MRCKHNREVEYRYIYNKAIQLSLNTIRLVIKSNHTEKSKCYKRDQTKWSIYIQLTTILLKEFEQEHSFSGSSTAMGSTNHVNVGRWLDIIMETCSKKHTSSFSWHLDYLNSYLFKISQCLYQFKKMILLQSSINNNNTLLHGKQ